jgi:hypothetical protein
VVIINVSVDVMEMVIGIHYMDSEDVNECVILMRNNLDVEQR